MKTPIILSASLLLAGCGIPEAMATSAQADSAARIAQANSAAQIANAQSAEQIANHYATLASNAMWASLLPGMVLLLIIGAMILLGIWGAIALASIYMEKKDNQHKRELAARMRAFELDLMMRERLLIDTEQPYTYGRQPQLTQQNVPAPNAIVINQRPRQRQHQYQ